jgi:hypothetical protein
VGWLASVATTGRHGFRNLDEFVYTWKADVGKKLANARKVDEYFKILLLQILGPRCGDEVEDVKVYLVGYCRQNSVDLSSFRDWEKIFETMGKTKMHCELTGPPKETHVN